MLDRQKSILEAAAQVFTRYGVKRATMNDIAAEAGVARQTLYNAFANKEAILRGIIENHVEQTCFEIRSHIESRGSLEDGLELAFDHFARKPYEILRNTPHGGEIMESFEDAAGAEMEASKQRFHDGMIAMLEPHISAPNDETLSARALADFVVHTAMGHKAKATSEVHLETLLATLKSVVLKAARG